MQATKPKQPIVYSGEGSAIDNYLSPKPEAKPKEKKVNWKAFKKDNPKHKVILSLLYQANWTTHIIVREVPYMERFGNWLQTKAPVKKPLTAQDDIELEKTIKAFKGVIKSIYK